MRRALPHRLPAALLVASLAAILPGSVPIPAAAGEQIWIDLARPVGDTTGPVALAEIRGWAGAGPARQHDVILVVDVSGSTLLPSGGDVDGDGRVGRKLRSAGDPQRSFNPRRLCSDPGDTIRAAEILAARRFVASLDPERTRIGLVVFADRAELRVALGGSRAQFEAALDELEQEMAFGWGATDLSAAIRLGREALLAKAGAEAEPGRQRWMVVLSDGSPNLPGSPLPAAQAARDQAALAAAAGIRLQTFALGEEVMEETDVYRELAEATGGDFAWVKHPADVVPYLGGLDLTRVAELRVENTTTGEAGRAVRVSPDGRFDGLVPLEPGENLIRVTARGRNGTEQAAECRVHFERREPRTPEEVQAVAALLERLRARTEALELGVEVERYRSVGRALELEPVGGRPDVAAPPP
jgi:hypothetical protein